MARTRNKRSKKVVYPSFQYGLGLRMAGLVAAGMGVSLAAGVMLAQNALSAAVVRYGIALESPSELFVLGGGFGLGLYFVLILVVTMLLVLLTARYTNRLAGPVFRFTGVVKRMRGGDLCQDIRLRQNDSGKELAAELNGLCREFADRNERMTLAVRGAQACLDVMRPALAGDGQIQWQELAARLAQMEGLLAFYHNKERPGPL